MWAKFCLRSESVERILVAMRARACWGVWLALAVAGAPALGQVSKPGTSTVTGQVTCEDTQRPARFANVMLYEVPSSLAPLQITAATDAKARAAIIREMNSHTLMQVQTGIDGSFAAQDVPPGDYYVLASVAGYVQPRYLLQAAYDAGEDVLRGVIGVPVIHVSADHLAEVGITVSRGAAIEGHLVWDDGTPVNGAYVEAEPTTKDHKNLPQQLSMINMGLGNVIALTDDRGHYRISGLPPGEYRVRATLQTNSHFTMMNGRAGGASMAGDSLLVYAPDAFRRKDAKPVKLIAGEEHGDEDITFNISGTHTVSGRVTSAEDHHAIKAAWVQLRDETDMTFARGTRVDEDGNFSVTFVPPGTYALNVGGADIVSETDEKNPGMVQQKVVRNYKGAKQQVIVTDNDVTGENVELSPAKAAQTDGANNNGQQHEVVGAGH